MAYVGVRSSRVSGRKVFTGETEKAVPADAFHYMYYSALHPQDHSYRVYDEHPNPLLENFMLFIPCIVTQLYSVNQPDAHLP